MQVGAGRPAGRADIADQVALPDAATWTHAVGKARHVCVERLEIVGVADLHRPAVVEVPALMADHAIGCGMDRFAGLALEVDAVVEAAAALAAIVAADTERRRNAGPRPRIGEGSSAQPAALLVEPAFGLVGRREPPEGLLVLPVAEAGKKNAWRTIDGTALEDFDLRGGRCEARQRPGQFRECRRAGAGRRQAGGQRRAADFHESYRAGYERPGAGADGRCRAGDGGDSLIIDRKSVV